MFMIEILACDGEGEGMIYAMEDGSGDPCYFVKGHVPFSELQAELAGMSAYGEDAESAGDYIYSHAWNVDQPASSRWPDGSWLAFASQVPGSYPITLAALWMPRDRPLTEPQEEKSVASEFPSAFALSPERVKHWTTARSGGAA